jgi:AraC-like DNA-binding protein
MDVHAMKEITAASFSAPSHDVYVNCGSALVWCANPSVGGAIAWGTPREADVVSLLEVFDRNRHMTPAFDMVLDMREVEAVDLSALTTLTTWMGRNKDLFLRMRVTSIVRPDVSGFLLAGLLPTIAPSPNFTVLHSSKDIYARLGVPDVEAKLAAALEAARSLSREVQCLRTLLRSSLDLSSFAAAKQLGMSERSLRRALAQDKTSFREEVSAARFAVATELLARSDLKVQAVAARVGLSESALARLFRDRADCTPAQWRQAKAT